MAIDGLSKLTRLQVMRLYIDFTKDPHVIRFTSALSDPDSGVRAPIRQGTSTWSKETAALARQLLDSLERDVARTVLVEGASATTSRTDEPDGLGERFRDKDIPDM
jgi:hypothetical protein